MAGLRLKFGDQTQLLIGGIREEQDKTYARLYPHVVSRARHRMHVARINPARFAGRQHVRGHVYLAEIDRGSAHHELDGHPQVEIGSVV